jgi:hypothetical protein
MSVLRVMVRLTGQDGWYWALTYRDWPARVYGHE